jgi:hypothetical protein
VFRGPDADVLLSDPFASSHCFHLVAPPDAPGDWVGIAFTPGRARRGSVEIAGTLWLDRVSLELRRIEFGYAGLPDELTRAKSGGTIEFTRLANGSWLTHRWAIRMPRIAIHSAPVFSSDGREVSTSRQSVVEGLIIAGGEVTSVEQGPAILYSTGDATRTDASAAMSQRDREPACADPSTTNALAALSGTVFQKLREPVDGALVRVTWRRDFRRTGEYQWSFTNELRSTTSSDLGWWFICGAPRMTLLTTTASFGGRVSAPAQVRIPRERGWATIDLQVPPR